MNKTIVDRMIENKRSTRTRKQPDRKREKETNYLFTGLIIGIVLAWIAVRLGDRLL